ncbi:MAG: hypothetical protein MUP16_02070, partial [Sedimentisphaerales bacterium]|nr:hypothetical protein [Sedimentisphaerales bacterium]
LTIPVRVKLKKHKFLPQRYYSHRGHRGHREFLTTDLHGLHGVYQPGGVLVTVIYRYEYL